MQTLIEVFGLGYVGFPLATRLSSAGYVVRGIDTNENRIAELDNKELSESDLLLKKAFLQNRQDYRLILSTKATEYGRPKIGIICVPTPIPSDKVRSDVYVNAAVNEFLDTAKKGDMVIIESSVEVGTTENVKKIIEHQGYRIGVDFGLAFCPERIDPQNKKWNLTNIPRVIYCTDDLSYGIAKQIYQHVNNSNLVRVSHPRVAETVKSFENAFRLVNISLVNELAVLCDQLGISVSEVIKAATTKPFGFMPFYPSAGAGGHCIPKDPRFLLESSRRFGSEFSMISSALRTNSLMPEYVTSSIDKILKEKNLPKKVLICGMTYKPDTEDMRDSPGFKILKHLLDMEYCCTIYDPYFRPELSGKYLVENHMKDYSLESIPSLDGARISNFSCICVCQPHSKTRSRLQDIYNASLVPVIYDCQNRLSRNDDSLTILQCLGD